MANPEYGNEDRNYTDDEIRDKQLIRAVNVRIEHPQERRRDYSEVHGQRHICCGAPANDAQSLRYESTDTQDAADSARNRGKLPPLLGFNHGLGESRLFVRNEARVVLRTTPDY